GACAIRASRRELPDGVPEVGERGILLGRDAGAVAQLLLRMVCRWRPNNASSGEAFGWFGRFRPHRRATVLLLHAATLHMEDILARHQTEQPMPVPFDDRHASDRAGDHQ